MSQMSELFPRGKDSHPDCDSLYRLPKSDLDALLVKAKREERVQCLRDICKWCEIGNPPARYVGGISGPTWSHRLDNGRDMCCAGQDILERVYQQDVKDGRI